LLSVRARFEEFGCNRLRDATQRTAAVLDVKVADDIEPIWSGINSGSYLSRVTDQLFKACILTQVLEIRIALGPKRIDLL
jgi:hypothetical protein